MSIRALWIRLNDAIQPGQAPRWLRRAVDLAALAAVVWFAFRYAGFWLRDDLYLFGDHPGQFYRMWQALDVIWPQEKRLIGWSPYWYAGYPELQFYPPGFVILGWGVWTLSLHRLSLVAVYQILLFVAYLLPGVGFYALLAWGLRDRLAGLTAAWLAMISPTLWGGVRGLNTGLAGERLVFGLIPLTLLAGLGMLRWRRPWLGAVLTSLLLTATLLMHPFHAVAPVVMLAVVALFSPSRWRHLQRLAVVVLLTWTLAAFWLLPLLVRQGYTTPIVRADLQQTIGFLRSPWMDLFYLPIAATLIGLAFGTARRRAASLGILLGGLAVVAFIFLGHLLLMDRLNFFLLDPVRFVASTYVALVVAIALGVSHLAWIVPRLLHRFKLAPVALVLLLAVPYFFYTRVNQVFPFDLWMQQWQPGQGQSARFYSQAAQTYDLPTTWSAIASTEGRVLFTSYYWHLDDVPTSLKAAIPISTGREMIGGTFSHWTPLARYLWTGDVNTPVLHGRAEELDDRELAGVDWGEMTDDFFFDLCRRLNVTLVAASRDDQRARAFLDEAPHFSPAWVDDNFFLYNVQDYSPAWADADGAHVQVTDYQRTAITLRVSNATPNATVHIKVAEYPLWQARVEGQRIPIASDELGLMQLTPPGGDSVIELRYRPGWAERLGSVLSLLTAIGLVWLGTRSAPKN